MSGQTFVDLLAGSSSRVTFDNQSTVTAPELAERGLELAAALAARGLTPGDRVGTWLGNGRPYLELLAACAAGSFVLVNANTRYSPVEASTLLRRSGASLVVTGRGDELSADVEVLTTNDLASLERHQPTANQSSPEDPFLVFTTSGTTSKPKMVLHRQHSIVNHSYAVAAAFDLAPHTPSLIALPLCGVFGLNSFAAAVAGNSPIWLTEGFDANQAASLVAQHSIVAMNGSDDMFHRMLSTDADLSSLRICGFAGFNTSLEDIVERADNRGVTLGGLYGMSEVQGLLTFRRPDLPSAERRKAGGHFSSPDAAVRVVDPETGEPLGHSIDGEVQLRGPSLFAGYLAEGGASLDHDLTASTMAGDWFRTGDLGSTTPADEGEPAEFTFVTRMGDVLRLGGFLVAPTEIEEVLLGFDGIVEAQVVAAATPKGARPVAFVISETPPADDSAMQHEEEAIVTHCSAWLAKFKCPVRVIWLDSFPTTDGPNGVKIQRAKLRELAEAAIHAP